MTDVLLLLATFALALLVGYALISRVPPMLHTPLMSMTNAISAITILAVLLLFAVEATPVETGLALLALVAAAFNLAGGFAITDRMLRLFGRRKAAESTD